VTTISVGHLHIDFLKNILYHCLQEKKLRTEKTGFPCYLVAKILPEVLDLLTYITFIGNTSFSCEGNMCWMFLLVLVFWISVLLSSVMEDLEKYPSCQNFFYIACWSVVKN
jgi:hypothetical protein